MNERSIPTQQPPKRYRYKILLGLLCGLAVFGLGPKAMNAQEGETRTLTLATLAPPGSTWMRIFTAWNRELRRRQVGLQLRIYAGGVQGDEAEVVRKIRSGRLDIGAVTANGLAHIHRPALVFQIPGIIRTYQQLDRAREALSSDISQGFEQSGFHMLGWADVGQARIFSTQRTVNPSDFVQRHAWVWRGDVIVPELYRVVRTNPVPLEVPEVLGAIQTGRVDTLMAPPVVCLSLQWCSRLNHMADIELSIVLGGTVMGQSQWNSLNAAQQQVLNETGEQFSALARRNLRNDETQALRSLEERGLVKESVSQADINAWEAVGREMRQRLSGQIADADMVARVAQFGSR